MDTRKLTSFALALTLTASLASCSETKKSGSDSDAAIQNTTDAELAPVSDFTTAFRAEDYDIPVEYSDIYVMDVLNDTDEFIVNVATETKVNDEYLYDSKLYRTDRTLTKFTELNIPEPEEALSADEHFSSYYFNPDGSLFAIVELADHGGVTEPEEYDENFDYDSYFNNAVRTYMLARYDKDYNLISAVNFEYPESFYNEWSDRVNCIYAANGDHLLCCHEDGSVWRLDPDGSFKQLLETPEDNTSGINYVERYISFLRDRDGKLVAKVPEVYKVKAPNEDYEYDAVKYNYCDFTDGKLSEPFYKGVETVGSIQSYSTTAGYGDYRILLPEEDALIGITDSGERVEIINWMDSDVESMNVIPLGNDVFLGLSRVNNYNSDMKLKKLTRRDPSEFANIKVVTIGSAEKYAIPKSAINDFNAAHSDYRIKIKEIKSETDAVKPLGMALMKGDAPDVIYDISPSEFFNLRGKDAFDDLSTYMAEDSSCSKDSFMPNIIKAMSSTDGKLYGMPASFGVETLVTKTEVNSKENWTFDDMTALFDNPPIPAERRYDFDTKEEMLQYMLREMSGLIDYEKAECHFDSPDFVKMLEFCNRFVSEVDQPSKMENPDAHQMWYTDKHYRLRDNTGLTEPLSLYAINSYSFTKNLQAGGADLTLAGFPSSDGKGGRLMPNTIICINAKAKEKDGAWEVVKYLLGADSLTMADGGMAVNGFPTLIDRYEEYIKKDQSQKNTYNGIEAKALTPDEEKTIREFILNCDTLATSYDDDMYSICLEEAEAYFNGEISAETAAEHIQNRVSILVSERS